MVFLVTVQVVKHFQDNEVHNGPNDLLDPIVEILGLLAIVPSNGLSCRNRNLAQRIQKNICCLPCQS
jgi:hypothetical protein